MQFKIEKQLVEIIRDAVTSVPGMEKPQPDSGGIYLEVPKVKNHGDYSTNVAMRLSRDSRIPLAELAASIRGQVASGLEAKGLSRKVTRVEVLKPGFINFHLSDEAFHDILAEIHRAGKTFGSSDSGKDRKVLIEFVSANPTGPLSVAHGRQAAFGDSLSRILKLSGYSVQAEYYNNDAGNQINLLGESVWARCRELSGDGAGPDAAIPEDGYKGEYVKQIAADFRKNTACDCAKKDAATVSLMSGFAAGQIMDGIREDLRSFDVEFDTWFSQKEFEKTGKVEAAVGLLRQKGHIYEKDGAVWFASTKFGDDKDRVLVKSDGTRTYLTPDIGYHKDKFERGFDRLIDMWGPDHHGYIPRMKAAVSALGYDPARLDVIIIQLCTLFEGKKQLKMSTRAGEYVTLKEVIDQVGKDAGRFFYLMRKADSHLDFDLELAKKQTSENPVYYVQYAHARISNIINFSASQGTSEPSFPRSNDGPDLKALSHPQEIELIRTLRIFPAVIRKAADNLEPCGVAGYLQELAGAFHLFYEKCRVVTEDEATTRARLFLIGCVRNTLCTGLNVLGVSAPGRM